MRYRCRPMGMSNYSYHAMDRRCERGIKGDYVELCKSRGMRTNVPDSSWRHKYMFKGLHVIIGQNGSVVTAFWVSDDLEQIKEMQKGYDDILLERKQKLAKHSQGRQKAKNHNKNDSTNKQHVWLR